MPAGKYQLDEEHASILWKVSHFGFSTYPGRFTGFEVDLVLAPTKFSDSTVSVTIDPKSIQTSYPNPDKEDFDQVLAVDWFLANEHPEIRFESSSVTDLNGKDFTINGTLTMAGKSAPVSLAATFNKATTKHILKGKPVIGFSATTTLDRTEWGITKYAPGIGAEVSIEIEGEFIYNAE
jgi:polyisoprenoid-binding protein YceI